MIFKAQMPEWIRTVTTSTLIIQGQYDDIASLDNVRALADELPRLSLVVLDAGHRLVFTQSATIASQIDRFFQAPEIPTHPARASVLK